MKYLFKNARLLGCETNKFLTVDDRLITYIGDERPLGSFDRIIDCTNQLIVPGFYNCHCHAPMTLFRGYGENMPLASWLNDCIFPAEELLTNEAVYTASLAAIAEMIKNGIVSFSDMYMFSEETVKAAVETGVKANIARCIVSFDGETDKSFRFAEARELFEKYHNAADGRIKIDMSLHAEYTNTPGMCEFIAGYAGDVGTGIQLHLSETEKEHNECIQRHGVTPTRFFADCGVLDVAATAAHCVYVTDADIEILAAKGVTAAHNPCSNLKLGSGVMPLEKLLLAGVNVTLGTDGAASNNSLDIMREMYTASVLHKGIMRSPEKINSADIIKMATQNGAAAQGREGCGRTEVGCCADIVMIDADAINNIPCFKPEDMLVYSANSGNVTFTMADGQVLYEDGEYTTIDIEKVKYDMRDVCEHYFQR